MAEELDDVERHHLAGVRAAGDQPAVRRHRRQVLAEPRPAGRVDDGVDAAAAGRLGDGLGHRRRRGSRTRRRRRARAPRRPSPARPPTRSRARRRCRAACTAAPATPPDADGTSTVSPARTAATDTHHRPRGRDDALGGRRGHEVVRPSAAGSPPAPAPPPARRSRPSDRCRTRRTARTGPGRQRAQAAQRAARVLLVGRDRVAGGDALDLGSRPRRRCRRTRRPAPRASVNGQRDVPARESRSLWLRPHARTSIDHLVAAAGRVVAAPPSASPPGRRTRGRSRPARSVSPACRRRRSARASRSAPALLVRRPQRQSE